MSGSVPLEARDRLLAQARYAGARLESILSQSGLKLVTFDGAAFETNLPAVAINADDFAGNEDVIVERTLEPAIIADMNVIITGKVLLASAPGEES